MGSTKYYVKYSYEAKDNLKEYTIIENKYTEGKFGEKEVISLKPGSTGENERFYAITLEDFITGSRSDEYYYWYKNSTGKMDVSDTSRDFGTGYTNTGTIIDIWNAG